MRGWILGTLALSGCGGLACTELGCDDEYEGAFFAISSVEWAQEQDVAYTFTVVLASETVVCSGTAASEWMCDPGLDVAGYNSGQGESAYYVAQGLVLETYPASATVLVERDGVGVVDQDFDIQVETYRPNGGGCEPECSSWTGELSAW